MNSSVVNNKLPYLKTEYDKNIEYKFAILFFILTFFLPQYFGFNTPGFDLSAQRIGLLLALFLIFKNRMFRIEFYRIVKHCTITQYIALFLFICLYTVVVSSKINTFFAPFLEYLLMYVFIFIIKNYVGIEKTVKLITKFLILHGVLGIVEYMRGETLFAKLETLEDIYTGIFIRSGQYRIMGAEAHSLGYGLLLLCVFPLTCINFKENRINIFNNIIALVLTTVNVFLTGSRSTLALFAVELVALFIFSDMKNKKRTTIYALVAIGILVLLVVALWGKSFSNYIMLQITSVLDEVLGTSYSIRFGAQVEYLEGSSLYREALAKVYTRWDVFSPIIGKGADPSFVCVIDGWNIKSVDNQYIVTFMELAYPGLVAFLLLIFTTLGRMFYHAFKNNSVVSKCVFIGVALYFINLKWVADLMTMKYVLLLFAIHFVDAGEYSYRTLGKVKKNKSKYFKF